MMCDRKCRDRGTLALTFRWSDKLIGHYSSVFYAKCASSMKNSISRSHHLRERLRYERREENSCVEDDDVSRELMRMALERHGYIVATAEDGMSGYELAVSFHPDLIITISICPRRRCAFGAPRARYN